MFGLVAGSGEGTRAEDGVWGLPRGSFLTRARGVSPSDPGPLPPLANPPRSLADRARQAMLRSQSRTTTRPHPPTSTLARTLCHWPMLPRGLAAAPSLVGSETLFGGARLAQVGERWRAVASGGERLAHTVTVTWRTGRRTQPRGDLRGDNSIHLGGPALRPHLTSMPVVPDDQS